MALDVVFSTRAPCVSRLLAAGLGRTIAYTGASAERVGEDALEEVITMLDACAHES